MKKNYVLFFDEIDQRDLPLVGGKGANLGHMTKAGFPVPQGFCVTTSAYQAFVQASNEMSAFLHQLESMNADSLDEIRFIGEQIRNHLESLPIPEDVVSAVLEAWRHIGQEKAYAARSSATAEDLPTASFAGQQETYLNVRGDKQLLDSVRRCFASLFTDRAISYRARNGFDNRQVFLSVVVQEMVFPDVSGIMFTADPISGNRKVTSIDASFGLGEALVSGLVTADLYQIRSAEVVKKKVSKKEKAIYSVPEGGTITENLPPEKQEIQALPDDKILELARLGRKIEKHYGSEQDIEWGLVNGKFYILQSRPITSLYPIPPIIDHQLHVFANFGYIQMMTDPMKPLAISVMSHIPDFIKKQSDSIKYQFIYDAGGRVFADLTGPLSLKPVQNRLLKILKGMDEFMASALSEVMKRKEFQSASVTKKDLFWVVRKVAPIIIPAALKVVNNLFIQDSGKANKKATALIGNIVKETEQYVFGTSGADRIRRIQESMGNMLPEVLSKIVVYLIAGVLASGILAKKLKKKVGDEQGAFLLSQLYKSLPGNVTTEMSLALGDLADKVRNFPEVINYLHNAKSVGFYEDLSRVPGGTEFKRELEGFLQKYGMRCAGEIDISRPRWNEDPTQLIPSIISNIQTTSFGEHRKKFRQGEIEAEKAAKDIVFKFRFWEKGQISRLVKRYRNLMGMREHHKLVIIQILDIYKRAILEEARFLVGKGILCNEDDVFYFTLQELAAMLENRNSGNVQAIVEARSKQHELNQKRKSPRVMTSEGEIITGKLRDVKVPEGALVGTPVCAGVVEGIARVIVRLEDAKLNSGEILVAPYTDPGWTPLFTSAVGLVTEVGGMMTHGSVIAREYGIPAVVGIDDVTKLIKNGAYIRVDGTQGYVQILQGPDNADQI